MKGPDLLNRAQPDAISLAEGSVDSPGLSHAHLGATDQIGHVGGIGIAIADKSFGPTMLVDGCLEDPAVGGWITKLARRLNLNTRTPIAAGQPQEAGMGDIPLAFEKYYIACLD